MRFTVGEVSALSALSAHPPSLRRDLSDFSFPAVPRPKTGDDLVVSRSVAGTSLFVWRSSRPQPKIEPTGMNAGTLSSPAESLGVEGESLLFAARTGGPFRSPKLKCF